MLNIVVRQYNLIPRPWGGGGTRAKGDVRHIFGGLIDFFV